MLQQLGLIGCGLMGGSFALALRQAGLVNRVIGYSKSASTLARALQLGVIDSAADNPLGAATGCDLVLLAVPVAATESSLRAIGPAVHGGRPRHRDDCCLRWPVLVAGPYGSQA